MFLRGTSRGAWQLGNNATDLSGSGNHATFTGTGIRIGRRGPSRYFDGTVSDYASLGTSVVVTETGTFSIWIKFSDFTTGLNGTFLNIFSRRDPDTGGAGRFILRYYPSTSSFTYYFYDEVGGKAKTWVLPIPLVTEKWYHVAVSYDIRIAGKSFLVVNGVSATNTEDTTSAGTWATTNSSGIRIGYTDSSGSSYKGWAQDFSIHSTPSSIEELQRYYYQATSYPTIRTSIPIRSRVIPVRVMKLATSSRWQATKRASMREFFGG